MTSRACGSRLTTVLLLAAGPLYAQDTLCDFNGDGTVDDIELHHCLGGGERPQPRERRPPAPSPRHLKELEDKDITPEGLQAVRPDAVLIGERFYVGYSQLAPERAFGILTLDKDLKRLDSRPCCRPETGWSTTDLRMERGEDRLLWCAFETARMGTKDLHAQEGNAIHWAFYDASSGLPEQKSASGRPVATRPGGRYPLPKGTEATDDPVPFQKEGRYYIASRVWETPRMPIRAFRKDGGLEGAWDVDLSSALGGYDLEVYTLVDIEGTPWLIGSLQDGPPVAPSAVSYLAAIPLSPDLHSAAGRTVTLSKNDEYQTHVSGARYREGKLYVAHNVNSRSGDRIESRLKVFDVKDAFRLLDEARISSGRYFGIHFTVELADGRIYVFYPTPQGTLRVKVFEYR